MAAAIFVQAALSGEDCHWIVPTCPVKVKSVELVPVQTVVVAGVMVPATEAGLTVTVTTPEVALPQGLFNIAR